MGNILSAIHDDIEEYESLCEHFKEKPKLHKRADGGGINPYSRHCAELQARRRAEYEKEHPPTKRKPEPKQMELVLPEPPDPPSEFHDKLKKYQDMEDANDAQIEKLRATSDRSMQTTRRSSD